MLTLTPEQIELFIALGGILTILFSVTVISTFAYILFDSTLNKLNSKGYLSNLTWI